MSIRRSTGAMFSAIGVVLLLIAFWYVVAALLVFRFRNPAATETQLFTHLPDAVCWRKLDRFQEQP